MIYSLPSGCDFFYYNMKKNQFLTLQNVRYLTFCQVFLKSILVKTLQNLDYISDLYFISQNFHQNFDIFCSANNLCNIIFYLLMEDVKEGSFKITFTIKGSLGSM